jgi:hypothetical protein
MQWGKHEICKEDLKGKDVMRSFKNIINIYD